MGLCPLAFRSPRSRLIRAVPGIFLYICTKPFSIMNVNMLMNFIQDVNLDAPEAMNQVADDGFHVSSIMIILIILVIMLVYIRIRRRRQ